MATKQTSLFAILILAIGLGNCSSSETVEPAPSEEKSKSQVEETTTDSTANQRNFEIDPMDQINSTLREYRYPDGKRRKGFTYKKADVLKEDFNIWAKENVPFIKEALDKLPPEFKIQAIGHADARGPEQAEGGKKGNIYYSQIRAEAVKDAMVKQGIPAKRIVTKAAGSSNPVPGFENDDAINRRVTFQIIRSDSSDASIPGAPSENQAD